MTFGSALQSIRRSKRKTQRDVANAINMDYGYFSRLENDRFDYKPSRETVEKIAEALECNEEERGELLAAAGRIDEEMEKVAQLANARPGLRELFRTVSKLPPDEVRKLNETAQKRIKPRKEAK